MKKFKIWWETSDEQIYIFKSLHPNVGNPNFHFFLFFQNKIIDTSQTLTINLIRCFIHSTRKPNNVTYMYITKQQEVTIAAI